MQKISLENFLPLSRNRKKTESISLNYDVYTIMFILKIKTRPIS